MFGLETCFDARRKPRHELSAFGSDNMRLVNTWGFISWRGPFTYQAFRALIIDGSVHTHECLGMPDGVRHSSSGDEGLRRHAADVEAVAAHEVVLDQSHLLSHQRGGGKGHVRQERGPERHKQGTRKTERGRTFKAPRKGDTGPQNYARGAFARRHSDQTTWLDRDRWRTVVRPTRCAYLCVNTGRACCRNKTSCPCSDCNQVVRLIAQRNRHERTEVSHDGVKK